MHAATTSPCSRSVFSNDIVMQRDPSRARNGDHLGELVSEVAAPSVADVADRLALSVTVL
jgi:hypothetical protein